MFMLWSGMVYSTRPRLKAQNMHKHPSGRGPTDELLLLYYYSVLLVQCSTSTLLLQCSYLVSVYLVLLVHVRLPDP